MTNLSDLLKSVEPEIIRHTTGELVDRASYDRMKSIAVRLAEALNNIANQRPKCDWPQDDDLEMANVQASYSLADCAKMLEGEK